MKYKEAGNGWYITIFSDIERTASWNKKNKPGYYAEMMAWVAEGNEIEPQFTAEELVAKEATEARQALESQKQICENLLDQTQYIVAGDCDFPQEDVDAVLAWRVKIKKIMRGETLEEIPEKPTP